MRGVLLLLACLVLPVVANAEPTPFTVPKDYRWIPARISDGAVYGAIGREVWRAAHADDQKAAWVSFGCRLGLSAGVNGLVKAFVSRERPDLSNDRSMYSGHTSNAYAMGGYRFAIVAGIGRYEAKKHHASDILIGAAAGWLTTKVCP